MAVHTIDQGGNVQTNYIHSDHLGSSDTLTADNGTVSQQMSFDSFGLRRDPNNWSYDLTSTQIAGLKGITDKGYTSQEQLDNVGLVHMNGRVYDPAIGRMISADPTVPGASNSQAYNRYAYVYNNPIRFTDPSGYCPGGIFNPVCPSSPANPVNIINTTGNAASGAINTLTGGRINPGFSISRGDIENTLHHFDQAAANYLFRPDKTIEYNFPGLGNFTNVRFNHSQTLQRDVGDVVLAASVVVDVWSDGAATWFTSAIYGGYESYVTSLNGGTMLQGAEQGGIAYATSYALGSVNMGWYPSMGYSIAQYGAMIGADLGAYHAIQQGKGVNTIALDSLSYGLQGYTYGNAVEGAVNEWELPGMTAGTFTEYVGEQLGVGYGAAVGANAFGDFLMDNGATSSEAQGIITLGGFGWSACKGPNPPNTNIALNACAP